MALLPVRQDKPMAEARERIDGNFAQTVLYPSTTNPNRLRILGMLTTDKQQAYYATDGRDYLSPDTGVMKNGGNQTINGDLIVTGKISGNSLVIDSGGATIATTFSVYRYSKDVSANSLSFRVWSDRTTRAYGTLTSDGVFYAKAGMSVTGTIVASSNGHDMGTITTTGLTVRGSATVIDTITCDRLIANASITTNNIQNNQNIITNSITARSISAFNDRLEVFNGGNPGQMNLVRPMYCGPGTVPSNLPIGHLYGQYK